MKNTEEKVKTIFGTFDKNSPEWIDGIIPSSVEYVEQPSYDLEGCYYMIEKAARVCYASESGKKTPKEFVQSLVRSKHLTPLEFGTLHLKFKKEEYEPLAAIFIRNKYSKVYVEAENIYHVTTNFRVIIENYIPLTLVTKLTDTTENWGYYQKRYTFNIVTSEGIARELNTYRTHSRCQQSTRYCNYSSDKNGGKIFFIKPTWVTTEEQMNVLKESMENVRTQYKKLLDIGCKAQEAREVLSLETATRTMHCAYDYEWLHFLYQRYYEKTGKAHPDCKIIATQIWEILKRDIPNIDSLVVDENEEKWFRTFLIA